MSNDIADKGYTHVHRLTPLFRFWQVIAAAVAIFAITNSEVIPAVFAFVTSGHGGIALAGLAVVVVVLVVACLAVWLLSGIWWRRMGYRMDDEEIAFRRGVLSTHLRTARYDRTQAVDVVEPFLPRLFGLASVRVETAGGEDSAIEIGYLPKKKAQALHDAVLHRVRNTTGTGTGDGDASATDVDAGLEQVSDVAADDDGAHTIVPPIPVQRSVAAVVLNPVVLIGVLAVVIALLFPVTWTFVVPVLIASVPTALKFLNSAWKFNAVLRTDARAGEGQIEIAYGLTERRRQTIRVDRIHAVRISQPILWRRFSWYTVHVNVAGYGADSGTNSGSTRLLPVGSKDQALEFMRLATGITEEETEHFADPDGFTNPTYRTPKSAFWATPIDRDQQAVTLIPATAEHTECAVVHAGRLTRRMAIINTPHIQELTYSRGPINRFMGVSNVRFHLVVGTVTMAAKQLRPEDAVELLQRLRHRPLPQLENASAN